MVDSTHAFMLALALTASAAWSAEKLESLDEDFLAYLAEYEGDEDDWTIVEPVTAKAPAAKPAKTAKEPPPKQTATPEDGSKR